MERRPDSDLDQAAEDQADTVQGWQEDEPTEPELDADDGYHPDNGGPKYMQSDPVDEPLLAREEGLTPEGEEVLEADSETP